MTELRMLPCPFCGGEATMQPWHGGLPTKKLISCSSGDYGDEDGGCSVGPTVSGETDEEAVARWNRRAAAHSFVETAARIADRFAYNNEGSHGPQAFAAFTVAKEIAFEIRALVDAALSVGNEAPEDLIAALSRLAGNRHFDGTSTLVSREDRESILNGFHRWVLGSWLPISQADVTITDVNSFEAVGITIRNSDTYWVRDEDGRIFEACWTDHRDGYWWDLEGESPVDPVEFMPHPLDKRFHPVEGGAA